MNVEELREFCLSFDNITEEYPFGPDNLVYKLMGKMYALIPLDKEQPTVVIKNKPDINEMLKEEYSYITTAYHFNKIHWIAINNTTINPELARSLITDSYHIIKDSLPKKNWIEKA